MVTGASEGLGKSFAIESAKMGMDLFLVSLPGTGLPALSRLIKLNFEVGVDFLEMDLTDDQKCRDLLSYVVSKGYPISFLINNAGVGGNYQFENEKFEVFNRMIQLNIKALTCVTHSMIPILARQKESYILNVSSMIVCFQGPYKQVYGATKSYISYFSQSLGIELEDKHIHVSALCPGGMNTNIKLARIASRCNYFQRISVLDPEEVAESAIKKTLEKQKRIIPGAVANLYFYFSMLFPRNFKQWLVKFNNKKLLLSEQALSGNKMT